MDSFSGYDLLQGCFIIAVVNSIGLDGALVELVVTGFGVLTGRALVDMFLDIDDALGVQVAVDIDTKRGEHLIQTQGINLACKVFTKFNADDDIAHNHVRHAHDDVEHEQGKSAANNYSYNIHQSMLIHYFFYLLDIGQEAGNFTRLPDFIHPCV